MAPTRRRRRRDARSSLDPVVQLQQAKPILPGSPGLVHRMRCGQGDGGIDEDASGQRQRGLAVQDVDAGQVFGRRSFCSPGEAGLQESKADAEAKLIPDLNMSMHSSEFANSRCSIGDRVPAVGTEGTKDAEFSLSVGSLPHPRNRTIRPVKFRGFAGAVGVEKCNSEIVDGSAKPAPVVDMYEGMDWSLQVSNNNVPDHSVSPCQSSTNIVGEMLDAQLCVDSECLKAIPDCQQDPRQSVVGTKSLDLNSIPEQSMMAYVGDSSLTNNVGYKKRLREMPAADCIHLINTGSDRSGVHIDGDNLMIVADNPWNSRY